MGSTTLAGVTLLAFILGFRHGIDWDHITAIVDLVGGEHNRRRGFILTLWYAAGHETVIVVLGALAVFLGYTLPPVVDGYMERFVGITLLILAILFAVSLFRGNPGVTVSRWRIIVFGVYNVFGWLAEKIDGRRRRQSLTVPVRIGAKGAFGIGVVHGIGAETPTQLLLFVTASGLGSPLQGMIAVLSFVVGLLLSHGSLAVMSLVGYVNAARHGRFVRWVSYFAMGYSFLVGGIFTLGHAAVLPTLL